VLVVARGRADVEETQQFLIGRWVENRFS